MLVGQENAIQFVRRDSAELEPKDELARAQAAVDQQPAMIGCDQRAVPSAPAPEHGEAKHFRLLAKRADGHKRKPAGIVAPANNFRQHAPPRIRLRTMDAIDLAGLRREYETQGLRRAELHPDPIEQFATWFSTAINSGLPDANAIALATATPDGKPSARVVLLKGVDQRGFVFFTNYESKKGHELAANPEAAFVVYWMQLERQIRVTGRVEKTSREESKSIFAIARGAASSAPGSRARAK